MDESKRAAASAAWDFAKRAFAIACVAAGIGYLLFAFVIVLVTVPTSSMEPTIQARSMFLGDRLAYSLGEPERGDIAVFWHEESGQNYVKRVIGVPGDEVAIRDGKVYVNGTELVEDYASGVTYVNNSPEEVVYHVPEGHYFMLGDNRENSGDSRVWGHTYVAEDDFVARYIMPLNLRKLAV